MFSADKFGSQHHCQFFGSNDFNYIELHTNHTRCVFCQHAQKFNFRSLGIKLLFMLPFNTNHGLCTATFQHATESPGQHSIHSWLGPADPARELFQQLDASLAVASLTCTQQRTFNSRSGKMQKEDMATRHSIAQMPIQSKIVALPTKRIEREHRPLRCGSSSCCTWPFIAWISWPESCQSQPNPCVLGHTGCCH